MTELGEAYRDWSEDYEELQCSGPTKHHPKVGPRWSVFEMGTLLFETADRHGKDQLVLIDSAGIRHPYRQAGSSWERAEGPDRYDSCRRRYVRANAGPPRRTSFADV